ncbi:hypothetical protein TNCT_620641 [Trichonephila clavata]|uniref:Uncharacterized protein n=1 Tax=Trichonephila clavata TaxID=2740835 RepID=A0A8X6JQW2_TRICU|nr:hypothetical protein TNCT_620641 [Trichonephila clavata]
MTINSIKYRVKLGSELSDALYTEKGLKRADSPSSHLFSRVLEKTIRASGIQTGKTILVKLVQLQAFANDTDIVGRTKAAIVEAFTAPETAAKNRIDGQRRKN